MPDEAYYVRWRGQVRGPFQMEDLRRLIAHGELSALHDVSTDRMTWRRASTMTGLFGAIGSVKAVASDPGPRDEFGMPQDLELRGGDALQEAAEDEDAAGLVWHYYAPQGVLGPQSTADMVRLVREGKLAAETQVHNSRDAQWRTVREAPELSHALPGSASGKTAAVTGPASDVWRGLDESATGPAPSGAGMASTAFTLAVIGLFVPVALSVAAIVTGFIALRRTGDVRGPKRIGMARSAVILGAVGLVFWAAVAVVLFTLVLPSLKE